MARERDHGVGEGSVKRHRVEEGSSSAGDIDNPLVPYNDVDEEEDNETREQNNGGMDGDEGGVVVDDDGDDDDEYNEQEASIQRRRKLLEPREDCPYLDTVNRQVLDFDFEKFCSVSLSNLNVYACLVCGKYYQGRGKKSHAYTHSLEAGHHVYINLQTEKVYCLPDGYEIIDPSLDDIRHVLNPRFTREQVAQLDKNRMWSRALDGSDYLPGMVGLNNIQGTDFVNVTIQSLMRVTPLRNFFLIPENYQHNRSSLVQRFGELTRKIWHARNFKGQVSPHEFLQAVMKASKKRFRIGQQSDPLEFISWLLNTLHAELKTSKKNNSIIYDCFQGELEVIKEIPKKAITEKKESGGGITDGETERGDALTEKSRMPFLMLGLDLPPPPLFKDVMEKNIIPQVPLFNILNKFDGETVTEVVRPHIARMKYRVTRLPRYIILHMQRFKKNNFFIEKNPTIVNFPVKNLELKDYIPLPTPKENEKLRSKYDLIANIVHDGKPKEGVYRVFVQRKSEELWYEMQDLHVSETLPQMVALSEAYLQIYEQHQDWFSGREVFGETMVTKREEIDRRVVDGESSIKRQKLEGAVLVVDDDQQGSSFQRRRRGQLEPRGDCPYLDTVNRQVLDFDFEKKCSVSLEKLDVYACLVCGKYYQGRRKNTHAYTHSLEEDHHVYINLKTEKVYCLPDGYEIDDPSLDDIRHVLNPRFTREQVAQLDLNSRWSRALDGSDYLPGMVGLNKLQGTDFVNVTIQSLMTVSPHEFLQAVMEVSEKRFCIGQQSDPLEFMEWLLKTLHAAIRTSKKNSSIIYDCFQGELEVIKVIDSETGGDDVLMEKSRMPFMVLGLDLPPPPLFKDAMDKSIIPQVPLFNILKKLDGKTATEVVRPHIAQMKYRVTKLPKYLILHMQRFKENNFFIEKNPTIVNFPVKNLELKDYIPLPTPGENKKSRSKYDLIANIVHDGKPKDGSYRVFVHRKSDELWYEMQDLHISETLPQMVALSEAYLQIYEQHQ
ncbi:unnamed protein product [Linum trigynum]|uniref:Uncharacterized protein n=1 Tax=Linum trigynum TaxID=586398 RepID=A0AAV2C8H8_9ROSI